MDSAFYDLSGDTLAQAEAQAEFRLVLPETARKAKKGEAWYWSEAGHIVAAYSEVKDKELEGRKCQQVSYILRLAIQGGSGKNNGGSTRCRMMFNKAAAGMDKAQGKWHGQQQMNRMSAARMKQFMGAVGMQSDLEGGGYSAGLLQQVFPQASDFQTEESPVVGREV